MAKQKEPTTTAQKRTFKVLKNKNFVGFMHPKTRKFISVDENGKISVDETDSTAIDILENAADLTEE